MAEDRATLLRAAKARSTKFGISFKVGKGHLTPPKGFPTSESDYADPVNFAYPLVPEARLKAAVSYFNQEGQREAGGYSSAEWRVIGQRIAAKATGKKYQGGKVVDAKEVAKELDYNEISNALGNLYRQYRRTPDDGSLPAYPIAVFPSGKAWFYLDQWTEPGDAKRNVLEANWVVEDGVVRITAWRPGTIEMRFTPLVAPQAQAIDHIEQVIDDDEPIRQRMKEIAAGQRRTAVLQTTCRLTGRPRWITVSSGSFPDRMGEIVTKDAQEFSVAYAREKGMYGPLRLAHLPHPFADTADVRTKWQALVGDFIKVFDDGLLPMLDVVRRDDLVTPWRIRNLVTIVGKDLALQVARGKITADVGVCDFQAVYGGSDASYPGSFLVESGLWYDTPLATKAQAYFRQNPGEVSQGFLFDRTGTVTKGERVFPIYNGSLWRFERSLLPQGAAAFPATGYLDGALGIATL